MIAVAALNCAIVGMSAFTPVYDMIPKRLVESFMGLIVFFPGREKDIEVCCRHIEDSLRSNYALQEWVGGG